MEIIPLLFCCIFFISFIIFLQRPPNYDHKVKMVKEKCDSIKAALTKSLAYHEKNPEKHPLYPEEWKKFWNRRYKEIQSGKCNIILYNFILWYDSFVSTSIGHYFLKFTTIYWFSNHLLFLRQVVRKRLLFSDNTTQCIIWNCVWALFLLYTDMYNKVLPIDLLIFSFSNSHFSQYKKIGSCSLDIKYIRWFNVTANLSRKTKSNDRINITLKQQDFVYR